MTRNSWMSYISTQRPRITRKSFKVQILQFRRVTLGLQQLVRESAERDVEIAQQDHSS